jgi:hypothetical protein
MVKLESETTGLKRLKSKSMKNQPEHVTTVSGESLSDEIILPQVLPQVLPQNLSKTRVDRHNPGIPKTKIVTGFLKQSPLK